MRFGSKKLALLLLTVPVVFAVLLLVRGGSEQRDIATVPLSKAADVASRGSGLVSSVPQFGPVPSALEGSEPSGGPWVEGWDTGADLEPGRRAPDFSLETPHGEVIRLSDFRGEKAVILNFWATWCPPCREEMPDFQRLYEARGDEVVVLAVNVRETPEQVKAFFAEYGLEFPALLDRDGRISQRYLIRPMPTTFFIDREGFIRHRHFGLMSMEVMNGLLELTLADSPARRQEQESAS